MQGKIINITRFCTDDGPGIRTTVFLKGCPLKCLWCHNPESQNPQEETYCSGEKVGRIVTVEEVLAEIERDRVFYETSGGGVTVSGGEPLFQPEFTTELLRQCKKKGIHTAIETSGYANTKTLNAVLKYCDLVLFDVKETDKAKHLAFTGVDSDPIHKNLRRVNELRIPFVIRLPIIPGFNDRQDHFLKVKELASELTFCQDVEIMPYHRLGEYKYVQLGRDYECAQVAEPTKQQIEIWKSYL